MNYGGLSRMGRLEGLFRTGRLGEEIRRRD